MGIWRYERDLRSSGLSRDDLGSTYCKQLEDDGISAHAIDRILSSVRSSARWVIEWEREAELLASREEHRGAATAYFVAKRWLNIDPSEAGRLCALGREQYRMIDHETPLQYVTFRDGDRSVAGIFQIPSGASGGAQRVPAVIIFPGLETIKEERDNLARKLLREGIAVLRVDLPGYGETGGFMHESPEFMGAACVRFLASIDEVDPEQIHTIGHCAGGMYAMGAAAQERVAGVTVVSAPMKLNSYAYRFPHSTLVPLMRAMNTPRRSECFARLLAGSKVPLTRVTAPVLAVYGGRDAMIPPSELQRIGRYVQAPVTPLFFEDEVHVCPRKAQQITEMIIARILQRDSGEAAA